MTRYRQNPAGQRIAFTAEEEAAADAADAADVLPKALAAFQVRRERSLSQGVTHAGHLWHTDPLSQHAMASAVVLGEKAEIATGQPWSTIWKTMDGGLTVTLAELIVAGLVVGAHVQACFVREAALITQAVGGNVAEALADIENGWP